MNIISKMYAERIGQIAISAVIVMIIVAFTVNCHQDGKAWIEPEGVNVVGVEEGAVKGEVGVIGSHNTTETNLTADGGSTVTTNSGSGWLVLGGVAFLVIYTVLIMYVFNIFAKRNKLMLDTVCQAVCNRGHENEVYEYVKQKINGNLLVQVKQKLRQLPIVDKPRPFLSSKV